MALRSGRAPGRPWTFDRDVALEKALHLFWQHGYQATSIASLTEAMGIQAPSLYGAFGDKRALFRECVRLYRERHEGEVLKAFAEEPTAGQAIHRMLRVLAAKYTDRAHPPGCLVISATAVYAPESADVAEELRLMRNAFKKAVTDRIAHDVRTGCLPADADATGLATFYVGVVQGMSRQAQDGATRRDLERVADLAMFAWPDRGSQTRRPKAATGTPRSKRPSRRAS